MTPRRTDIGIEAALAQRLDNRAFTLAGTISLLFCAAYSQTFVSLVKVCWGSDSYAHGFLATLISMYIVWLKGKALLIRTTQTATPGPLSGQWQ